MRLAALLFPLLLAACADDPAPQRHPALWEVSAPGGSKGYVFGTIHALPEGLDWDSPALDKAISASDRLVLELAEETDAAASRDTFLELGTTPGQLPLDERIDPKHRAALKKALADTRLDPGQFASLEDWATALTLSLAVEAKAGFDPANGADVALQAKAGNRPVIGLETLAGQLSVFDQLPVTAQKTLLNAVIEESAARARSVKLVEAWASGDMATLDTEAHSGMLADPRLRDALLVERNREWTRQVAAMLRAGQRPFVAVGAAHVAGVDGLPAMLAAQGFEVRRVQ